LITKGWLLDCYPTPDSGEGMTFWIKQANGDTVKLRDSKWKARIYASGSACDSPEFLFSKLKDSNLVSSINVVKKRTSVFDWRKDEVLEIELRQADRAKRVADQLESIFQNPLTFRLYNVDLSAEQQYFLEKDLFPLGRVSVYSDGDEISKWRIQDDVRSTDYEIPQLRVMGLNVTLEDKVPRLDSRLTGISLSHFYYPGEEMTEPILIQSEDEAEIIQEAEAEVRKFDPDFIITGNGDSFIFPYLYSKAQKHGITFNLDRDPDAKRVSPNTQTGGRTYFSYGRIIYRPTTQRFFGRIHVDGQNTFVYDQCRFEGLFEIARISRMPFHTSSRASIGKSLSGLQFYHAFRRDTLIPYKPVISEDIKSMENLLVADRGGLVFVPLPGVQERVCEFDFASLYPSIIRGRNISAETVNCPCCPDSENMLEELNMHICKRKVGIVPESLELPLTKRFDYKRLRDQTNNSRLKQVYNERAGALKWVLVTSFGYLSFRHAKFMKIDAHIAVCSVARRTLLGAMHVAEGRGYQVIHGIVDSLWVHRDRIKEEDCEELRKEIEEATKFKLAIEGIYKWIVFLPSKVDSQNQVPTRYFGCFEKNNEMKVRGIEYRRHDTPIYFKKCQELILKELSKCDTLQELEDFARKQGIEMFNAFAKQIEEHDVPPLELLINRRLSKNLKEYFSKRQLSVNAALKLEERCLELKAGQSVAYVITKYKTTGMNRALPEELAEDAEYDSRRYVELLADTCATVLSPFGVTREILLSRGQSLLSWI
jgi:DNA polymerase elongation subunit (family B)